MSVIKSTFGYPLREDVEREAEIIGEPIRVFTAESKTFEPLPPDTKLIPAVLDMGIERDDKALHLCWSASKDFSLFAAGVGVAQEIADAARQKWLNAVFASLEDHAALCNVRRGADGKYRIPAVPEAIVGFVHGYSVADGKVFPSLHVHALQTAMCVTADGHRGQNASLLENYYRTQTADRAFIRKVEQDILTSLGVRTELRADGKGYCIADYPRDFVSAMSPASRSIREAVAERGMDFSPFWADQFAQRRPDRHRMPSDQIPTRDEARDQWVEVAKGYGFERISVTAPDRNPAEREAQFLTAEIMEKAVHNCTAGGGSFTPLQLKQAALEVSLGYPQVSAEQVVAEVHRVIEKPKLYGLGKQQLHEIGETLLRKCETIQLQPDRQEELQR
jgi:hypothetical protein